MQFQHLLFFPWNLLISCPIDSVGGFGNTFAPAAVASPNCDNAVLPGQFGMRTVQIIPRHRIRPRPQWGQGWRKGGDLITLQ
jgi:hypothetical protein